MKRNASMMMFSLFILPVVSPALSHRRAARALAPARAQGRRGGSCAQTVERAVIALSLIYNARPIHHHRSWRLRCDGFSHQVILLSAIRYAMAYLCRYDVARLVRGERLQQVREGRRGVLRRPRRCRGSRDLRHRQHHGVDEDAARQEAQVRECRRSGEKESHLGGAVVGNTGAAMDVVCIIATSGLVGMDNVCPSSIKNAEKQDHTNREHRHERHSEWHSPRPPPRTGCAHAHATRAGTRAVPRTSSVRRRHLLLPLQKMHSCPTRTTSPRWRSSPRLRRAAAAVARRPRPARRRRPARAAVTRRARRRSRSLVRWRGGGSGEGVQTAIMRSGARLS